MTAASSPENSGIRSFDSDVEYLMAELEWIRVRTRRIEVQREISETRIHPARIACNSRHAAPAMSCAEQLDCLKKAEDDIRRRLDSRLDAGRAEGQIPALIRMCRERGLGDFERNLLLLAVIPCLGASVAEKHLHGLESVYAASQLYPETVFDFLELAHEERIHALLKLLPDGTLRREGLIQLCYEPSTPASLVGVGIELTGKAMSVIAGVSGFAVFTDALPTREDE